MRNGFGKRLVLGFAFLFSLPAFAVSEGQLPVVYFRKVMPYFAQADTREFSGVNGVPIRYKVFKAANEKGAIVLLNGRGESLPKYAELIYDLRKSGYSIYAMDHRGQGMSGRMTPDPWMGYVRDYRDYLADVDTFMRTVVNASRHPKVFLLAHSLGAAIGAAYAIGHPHAFTAMALVSPMYQINTGRYTEWEAYLLALGKSWIGQGRTYAPGRSGKEWNHPFSKTHLTHSEVRYNLNQEMLLKNPSLALGGPSCHWVEEAIELDWYVRSHADSLRTPTLMLQASEDRVVMKPAEDEVCSHSTCQKDVFQGADHEILMESDPIRDRAISDILDFFSRF